MKKTIIILNPAAHSDRASSLEDQIQSLSDDLEVRLSKMPGDAERIARTAAREGFTTIIAAGGDGTINEVVNGLLGGRERFGREAALGIVPFGTGSDFVKVLDGVEPNDMAGAVRRLATGRTRPVDVGLISVESPAGTERRHFINGLGMGIDAQVAVESLKLISLKGFAIYLMAIIRALATYKSHVMTVRFDDYEVRRRLLFASVASGRSQGGGFLMTPEALIDDGLLDLCIVDKLRLDQIIRYLPMLMEGSHTRLRVVTMGRARHIEVTCQNGIPVATDGEVVATSATRVCVDVVPGAVQLVV